MRAMEASISLYHASIKSAICPREAKATASSRPARPVTKKVKGFRTLATCVSLHRTIDELGWDHAHVVAEAGGVRICRK